MNFKNVKIKVANKNGERGNDARHEDSKLFVQEDPKFGPLCIKKLKMLRRSPRRALMGQLDMICMLLRRQSSSQREANRERWLMNGCI